MRLTIVLVLVLAGCAPRYFLTRDGATAENYKNDIATCDYETSAATQGTDPSLRSIFGQELDRANRKNDLMLKCMLAKGWKATRAPRSEAAQ